MPMGSVSNNVVLAHMLQSQHLRRAWNYLRSAPAAQRAVIGVVSDARPSVESTSAERAQAGSNPDQPDPLLEQVHPLDTAHGNHGTSDTPGPIPAVDDQNGVDEGPQEGLEYDSCVFQGEAEDDYTVGPCRLMAVPEFDKHSVALMLKFDLSARIQGAIEAQRLYQKAQAHAKLQCKEIDRAEEDIRKIIRDKKMRLYEISEKQENTDLDGPEADDEVIVTLRRELDVLQHVRDYMDTRKSIVQDRLRNDARNVEQSQAELMEYFDPVFTEALLVPPPDDELQPIEAVDLDQEYLNMSKELYGGGAEDGDYTPEPLTAETVEWQTRNDPIQTPEEKARRKIEGVIWDARGARDHAERLFDNRQERRDQEWEAHRIAEFNGLPTDDVNQEAFDHRWIINDRQTTRALIEAEETLAKAKAAAADAGIEILDPEDNVPEYAYEFPGYPLIEGVVGTFTPNPRIEAWMEIMGEPDQKFVETAAPVARMDYWNYREIEIGDSESCVDMDYFREEIDAWQKAWPAVKVRRSNSV